MSLLMGKRATIVGTTPRARPLEQKISAMRTFETNVVPLLAKGAIAPIVDAVMPLADAPKAHERMASNAGMGKIVLTGSNRRNRGIPERCIPRASASPDRDHPRIDHRRRLRRSKARTVRAASRTPTTPPPVARSRSSRTSSGTRSCRGTRTRTPRPAAPVARPRSSATTHARSSIAPSAAGPTIVVIFCGSGATGAIDKIIDVMNLRIPADLDERFALAAQIPESQRPVVFIGPFEHHSNELPWRESIADVVVIHEDPDGHIDRVHLAAELARFENRPLKIGSFSAASNVSASCIDTSTRSRSSSTTMARCRSGTSPPPGVACARSRCATGPSGRRRLQGRRVHLAAQVHRRAADAGRARGEAPARREHGARHAGRRHGRVRQSGRAPLRHRSGAARGGRHTCDHRSGPRRSGLPAQGRRRHRDDPASAKSTSSSACVLGRPTTNIDDPRQPGRVATLDHLVRIVRHGRAYLHHNFVVALLNDLFGIQSRGGCGCAGPYGHRLLGIDLDTSKEFEREITGGCEGIKPGWVRVNFNYFLSEIQFQFIIDAIQLIARDGWLLAPALRVRSGYRRVAAPRVTIRTGVMRLDDTSYRAGFEYAAMPRDSSRNGRCRTTSTRHAASSQPQPTSSARSTSSIPCSPPISKSCAGSRCPARSSPSCAAPRTSRLRARCFTRSRRSAGDAGGLTLQFLADVGVTTGGDRRHVLELASVGADRAGRDRRDVRDHRRVSRLVATASGDGRRQPTTLALSDCGGDGYVGMLAAAHLDQSTGR